jgi:hypothetical protein
MIIVQEKKQPLHEMAQFRAAGIVVKVYSEDHGRFGNSESPAHAHVFDITGKRELGQVVLTSKNPPQTPSEVQWYRTENPTVAMSKAVVQFANTPNPIAKKLGGKQPQTLWEQILNTWFTFHEN